MTTNNNNNKNNNEWKIRAKAHHSVLRAPIVSLACDRLAVRSRFVWGRAGQTMDGWMPFVVRIAHLECNEIGGTKINNMSIIVYSLLKSSCESIAVENFSQSIWIENCFSSLAWFFQTVCKHRWSTHYRWQRCPCVHVLFLVSTDEQNDDTRGRDGECSAGRRRSITFAVS